MLRRAAFLAALILLVSGPASPAGASGDTWAFDPGGSVRTVAAGYRYYDEPRLFGAGNEFDGLSQTLLRLTLTGEAPRGLSFEGHLVWDLTWSTVPEGFVVLGSVGSGSTLAYRVTDASWEWIDEENVTARAVIDRLSATLSLPAADVTIGRQAVNFSQAYFWNPLDIFLAFDPAAFDRDYKPGVDAVRVDVPLGAYSGVTLVASPGRELRYGTGERGPGVSAVPFTHEPWYGSALVARVRTNQRGWDLTVQGGKVYGGWQAGFGFSGDARELGLRGEATWFQPAGSPETSSSDGSLVDVPDEHAALVLGCDHRFENSLHLNVEYLFNGAGGDPSTGLEGSTVVGTLSLGRHLLGIDASYEFHPLLNSHLSVVGSLSDGSLLVSPSLSFSLGDESEIIGGATLGIGDRPSGDGDRESLRLESEFGIYPNAAFIELKHYF